MPFLYNEMHVLPQRRVRPGVQLGIFLTLGFKGRERICLLGPVGLSRNWGLGTTGLGLLRLVVRMTLPFLSRGLQFRFSETQDLPQGREIPFLQLGILIYLWGCFRSIRPVCRLRSFVSEAYLGLTASTHNLLHSD